MKKLFIIFLLISASIITTCLYLTNIIPHRQFTSDDFGIDVITTVSDADNDGIDDYQDILQGAKITAQNKVRYHSQYYDGGYPPEDEGVCTDVIWRSLANAGYDLKSLVDADIASNPDAYPRTNGEPDPNIDFRRVPNLQVYFERNAQVLTTDLKQTSEWMPGDIVVFSDDHIAIISDIRNSDGIPFIIHNRGQYRREEDTLELISYFKEITGHYRINEIAEV